MSHRREESVTSTPPPSLAMSRPDPTAKRAQTDRKADTTPPGCYRRTVNAKCGRRGNPSGSEPVHSKKLPSVVTSALAAETFEVATLPVARRGQGQGGGRLNQLRFASLRPPPKRSQGQRGDGERGGRKLHGAWGSLEGPRRALAVAVAPPLSLCGLRSSPPAARAQSLTSHKGQRTSRLIPPGSWRAGGHWLGGLPCR